MRVRASYENYIKFYLVVGIHGFIQIANVVSLALCFYFEPLYLSIPIATVLMSPAIAGDVCVLNRAEQALRVALGLPERTTDYVGWYLFRRR